MKMTSDYKIFEFYFYLTAEPSNLKYKELTEESELKEMVDIYS